MRTVHRYCVVSVEKINTIALLKALLAISRVSLSLLSLFQAVSSWGERKERGREEKTRED